MHIRSCLIWRCDSAADTLCATYNDLESVRALFKENKGQIAGIILEPVVGNSGFIVPTQEFLEVRIVIPQIAILSIASPDSHT